MLTITQRQLNLKYIGYYYNGKIDGIEGEKTKKAYITFQKESKLVADGIYGQKTEQALMQYVKDVQNALNKSGIKLTVDGIVGKETIEAIKEYQKRKSLVTDGIAGEKTMDKLNVELAKNTIDHVYWENSKYFKKTEFKCGCGEKYCNGYPAEVSATLLALLERTRINFDMPLHITSGLRCIPYNKQVGGIKNSKHQYGKAADCSLNLNSKYDDMLCNWFRKQKEVSYTYTGFHAVHVDIR